MTQACSRFAFQNLPGAVIVAAIALITLVRTNLLVADDTDKARVVTYHGYTQAIELKRGNARAVLCPQAGGRVLEFSIDGKNAMFLDEDEKQK